MFLSREEKAKLAIVCWNTVQDLWKKDIGFAPYAQALEEDARRLAAEAKAAPE